ncbi:4Fe-4S binding protein [Streptomyces sp. RB6PN25]|uniref:4Fe-4S binding protein n=1 Tax=Streptomyces humicola TaxID=2953240 RepID=A0ABT1Q0F9_9ACTN|nr:4Fe-4S binding protein [Streptomyces humicola]MCQ4083414.1 4Fe-4S binding protein [Streptomyces humicola]
MTAGAGAAAVRVTSRCAGCGSCLLTCPTHAIRPDGGQLLVRADLCTGCVECIDVCPVDAIEETTASARAETTAGGAR